MPKFLWLFSLLSEVLKTERVLIHLSKIESLKTSSIRPESLKFIIMALNDEYIAKISLSFVGVSQTKIQMSLNQDTVRLLKKQIEDMVFWETEHNEVSWWLKQ